MKTPILCLTAILIALPAQLDAKCRGGGGRCGASSKNHQERAKRKAEREKLRSALKDYMDPIDKNNDGSISLREFLAASAGSEERFDEANKNGDRYLTKSEIAQMLGLDGMIGTSSADK